MLPTSTHLMPVIGLDLHLATSGNPFHPYVGMVIDPFDYIPFLGSNVNINGLKRGVSDTSGVLITFRHIPLVGSFIMMPIIGHESMNFFSSQTVFAEGTRLSPKGYMVMTCNDVGIPFSGALSKVGKKKFKFTPTLFAPTSFSIPIPTGAPVMVGGPYAPDWGGMLTGLLSSIGFSTLLSFTPAILKAMKKAGKKGGNLSKAYANKARKLMSGVADNTPLPSKKIKTSPFDDTGKLKPNYKYKSGEFGYNMETDGMGRICRASTDNLQLTTRTKRLKHNPNTPGKVYGNHAGHLFGDRFGGSPELDNLVSQAKKVNLSEFKKIENKWAEALKPPPQEVTVDIKINYDGSLTRPSSFNVNYTIDGEPFSQIIKQ